jgi:hypothetical protein
MRARRPDQAGAPSLRGRWADLEVASLDRVTESVDLDPYALRGQWRIDVPLWTPSGQKRPRRWSTYGAQRSQPVAIGRKWEGAARGVASHQSRDASRRVSADASVAVATARASAPRDSAGRRSVS